MKIVFITPGTGSYYCGACMRDNILARELHRAGHEVTIAPMYLPLMLDDVALPGLERTPLFFGGINVYLQHKFPCFRKTPAALDRILNSNTLLRWAARRADMTSAREHGEMTLGMLDLDRSPYGKESAKLVDWLVQTAKPDLVCLSNALLAGLAAEVKRRLDVPMALFFQGEDSFLDGLPEPYRSGCWTALARRVRDCEARLAPSGAYASLMQQRLGLAPEAIQVLHNGIALEDYPPAEAEPASPAIGYLARMSRDKGLAVLANAFIHLARELGDTRTRLRIAGACTPGDKGIVDETKSLLSRAGLAARVDWRPNLAREEKIAFLQSLTLFSVPAVYTEAFGLYIIEAMACGVPVVQPEASSFPEIVRKTGGGLCLPPDDPRQLGAAWKELLADAPRRAELRRAARSGVEKHFTVRTMAAQFLRIAHGLVRTPA